MTIELYKSILSVCPAMLKPIIKILLKIGVSYKQFAQITRSLFVEVASSEFGVRGRETNVSRVSIITGISRSEVTKIRKELEKSNDKEEEFIPTLNNASRVLTGWYSDATYKDGKGEPLVLCFDADEGPSFTELNKRYGGDVPATTMLKELHKTESVKIDKDENITVLKRYYMPSQLSPENVHRTALVVADICETLHYNLLRDSKQKSRIEGRAQNSFIRKKDIPKFHKFVDVEGQKFLEKIDEWLTKYDVSHDHENEDLTRLGMGLYYLQGNESNHQSNHQLNQPGNQQ
jgi:hypothetical protein